MNGGWRMWVFGTLDLLLHLHWWLRVPFHRSITCPIFDHKHAEWPDGSDRIMCGRCDKLLHDYMQIEIKGRRWSKRREDHPS
jgi:hypothetical protein